MTTTEKNSINQSNPITITGSDDYRLLKIGTLSLTYLRPPSPTLCQRSCGFGFSQRNNSTLLFLLDFIIVFLV
jgi:hypothetical protein